MELQFSKKVNEENEKVIEEFKKERKEQDALIAKLIA